MGLSGRRVLVIDDDPDLKILVRRVLEGAGIQVSEAESVEEGIRSAKETTPDVVILDIDLPGEDGFSFLKKRAASPALQASPVLMLSGQRDVDSVKKSVALGAANYLVKPFQAAMLLQKIRKIVHESSGIGSAVTFDSPQSVEGMVAADLVRMNASEILVGVPLRLGKGSAIELECELLTHLHCNSRVFRVNDIGRGRTAEGQYQSIVKFAGVSEQEQNEMTKVFASWTQKRLGQSTS